MTYWLLCLGYVAIRQELRVNPYIGIYSDTEAWMLWFAATFEISAKIAFCPILIIADMVQFFASEETY